MQRHFTRLLTTTITLAFVLIGCDQPTDSESDGVDGPLVLEGQIDNYDLGEQQISPSSSSSLGEGTLNPDGSFSMTFFRAQEIQEELQPVDPDGGLFDKFSGFICEEEADATLPTDARFAIAPALTFASDIDDDAVSEVATLGLSSDEPDISTPVPNRAQGDYHVRWIFASQSVTLDHQCSQGERVVDLELNQGWNEVAYDLSNRDQIRQYTGDRPSEVDWTLEI